MYATSDFKRGLKILIDEEPFQIISFEHVKPGKGNQFTRTKLKNLISGSNLERTFKSGEKFGVPDVVHKDVSFLYKDESGFNFMDQSDYEQYCLSEDDLGEQAQYLTENMQASLMLFNDRAIGIEIPKAVNLKVTYTEPGVKGNTATNATKPATMETGLIVQVPLHISEGDLLRVDTGTGKYVERINK